MCMVLDDLGVLERSLSVSESKATLGKKFVLNEILEIHGGQHLITCGVFLSKVFYLIKKFAIPVAASGTLTLNQILRIHMMNDHHQVNRYNEAAILHQGAQLLNQVHILLHGEMIKRHREDKEEVILLTNLVWIVKMEVPTGEDHSKHSCELTHSFHWSVPIC